MRAFWPGAQVSRSHRASRPQYRRCNLRGGAGMDQCQVAVEGGRVDAAATHSQAAAMGRFPNRVRRVGCSSRMWRRPHAAEDWPPRPGRPTRLLVLHRVELQLHDRMQAPLGVSRTLNRFPTGSSSPRQTERISRAKRVSSQMPGGVYANRQVAKPPPPLAHILVEQAGYQVDPRTPFARDHPGSPRRNTQLIEVHGHPSWICQHGFPDPDVFACPVDHSSGGMRARPQNLHRRVRSNAVLANRYSQLGFPSAKNTRIFSFHTLQVEPEEICSARDLALDGIHLERVPLETAGRR